MLLVLVPIAVGFVAVMGFISYRLDDGRSTGNVSRQVDEMLGRVNGPAR